MTVAVEAVDELTALFEQVCTAKTSEDALGHAQRMAARVKEQGGWDSLTTSGPTNSILTKLVKDSRNKTSGFHREGAMIAIYSLAKDLGAPFDCVAMNNPQAPLPVILHAVFDAFADKGAVVKDSAKMAVDALLACCSPYVMGRHLVNSILSYLSLPAKWPAKVAALTCLGQVPKFAPDQLARRLTEIIPVVTECMHDTKPEVSAAAIDAMTSICQVITNLDIIPFIPQLVKCMENPNTVPEAMKGLSHTTFVAEVNAPVLAVVTPLLVRALNERSQQVQRQTAIVVDNLCRLVKNPQDAKTFLGVLLPGVRKLKESAAMPEIRALASRALQTLYDVGAESVAATPAESAITTADVLQELHKHISVPQNSIIGQQCVRYGAEVLGDMATVLDYDEREWKLILKSYIQPWSEADVTSLVYTHFRDEYRRRFNIEDEPEDTDEKVVDVDFSLAYGGMMLLHQTNLTLRRGRRYGLCGPNGAGKSTLMRAIATGKVEGFPSLDEVNCIYVEHTLQGEEGNMSVTDFVAKDFPDKPRERIVEVLEEVGFNAERQAQQVGSLSGGWKMKLELARAMISNVDILLLDEPTNHLDVANVKWLEDYLNSQTGITSVIVSHDSGFLDHVCTDIIHYERKKLKYYRGNLSDFVKVKPEAKSYYTLTATNTKFSFPNPGLLAGINSASKAILRMRDVTFTYPGAAKPSLSNATCTISLSSRVGIIGANGAGKSTLIKLLTGELVPDSGKVEKHPNLRIGYVAQHSLHHVEQHLELTPNQYIQWRYQHGEDREVTEKETRRLGADEDIVVPCPDGTRRRIEFIAGRQKLKKSFQYEVKWRDMIPKFNTWIPRERLIELGFAGLVQRFDDWEAGREGLGSRELSPPEIRKHLEEVGLDGDIADNNEIRGLSGGQKVKVVIAGALWAKPHLLVLDEPSNYLDRDSLGGLAVAIRDWNGAVVMISHNEEFLTALCPERWYVGEGRIQSKGRFDLSTGAFEDETDKDKEVVDAKIGKARKFPRKKKLTKNQLKEREARRRLRHIEWLSSAPGTPRPEDTDDEEE